MKDIIEHNLTIQAGSDYTIDFLTQEDDGTPIDMAWAEAEAQLREKADHHNALPFECSADGTGIHLVMSHEVTEEIDYTRGEYDVFLLYDGTRTKFARGIANIIPGVTR